ncbi:MAG: ketoacyl-ACP synthase III [Proteobacteria bacterium]|nr:ketoacyl-ACP synthase III [Pseudomonadota bacterium]
MPRDAYLTSTGRFHPPTVVPNSHFYETLGLETDEEWIRSRTGVVTRHFAGDETTGSMGLKAAQQALDKAGLEGSDLDGIILASVTPDLIFPATSGRIQTGLGAEAGWAYDTAAACSGYVYALGQATAMVRSGMADRVMVVGSETMTALLDFRDRTTCVLFGDGAGATLIEACEEPRGGRVVDVIMRTDGNGERHLKQPAGGSELPPSHETVDQRLHYVKQEGRTVFKHAVTRICEVVTQVLERNGSTNDDIALFVPHQANIRIVEACGRRLKIPPEKLVVTVDRWANTTAATIPTSLDLALEEGRVKPGDKVVMATFGAGFTWGAALLQY